MATGNAEAIQKIIDVATAANNQTKLQPLPVALVPGSMSLKDIEPYMDKRARYRGILTTAVIDTFTYYVMQSEDDSPNVFIDSDNLSATGYLNLGDIDNPGHGDHRAELTLKRTAAFNAINTIDGSAIDQKELVEWVQDWHEYLSFESESGDTIPLAKAIAAIRNITIEAKAESTHSDGDFSARRSGFESIEASSRENTLPAIFVFKCRPCDSLKEREFGLRMSIITSTDKPKLKLRIKQKDALLESIAEEFKALLTDKLGDNATIYIGTFQP